MRPLGARAFRRYQEDGAELWFSPASGLHVRVETERTRRASRRVPRVVMFGITNRCNLRCDFCSRDPALESGWTVETAATLLEELDEAGVLEVAFGGGEPFVFAGFDALVARLHERTSLALSVTTNGTTITEARWAAYAGLFATVRLSLYPEVDWRGPARVLAAAGQRWGANVLVDDSSVDALPSLLDAVAAEGASDVSILSFIGLPQRVLAIGARQRLARAITAAPLPCRLSVCMGDEVPVHRLWAGATRDGDCGAGVDFVSILPDRTMTACSFHDERFPVRTARDVLGTYLLQRTALQQPSSREGCARLALAPAMTPPPATPPIAVWQGFSGNNSGECILAAKFSDEADAKAYVDALMPAWSADAQYPAAWRELFAAEKIAIPEYADAGISPRRCPEDLGRVGRTVIATGSGLDDVFPELRALAFRRRARVLPNGIHVHTRATFVAAVRAEGRVPAAIEEAQREGFEAYQHGEVVFLTQRLIEVSELEAAVVRIARGAPRSAEVVMRPVTSEDMTSALKQLGSPFAWRPRTVVSFSEWPSPTPDKTALVEAFVENLRGERHERAGSQLWFDTYRGTSRLAAAAMVQGAEVEAYDGEALRLHANVFAPWSARWRPEVRAALAASAAAMRGMPELARNELTVTEQAVRVEVVSSAPPSLAQPLAGIARAQGLGLRVRVEEFEPVLTALRRLREDLAG